jgi:hypothetical protein
MYFIQETGVASAVIPPETFVRSVSAGSNTASYWCTVGGVLAVPINPNDLHFTIGVITGDRASFHSTWHAGNAVTYFTCSANDATGALAVAHDVNNPLNFGPLLTMARAIAIAPIIYRAIHIDKDAFRAAKAKLSAQEKTRVKTGERPARSLFGSALKGTGLGVKPRVPLK